MSHIETGWEKAVRLWINLALNIWTEVKIIPPGTVAQLHAAINFKKIAAPCSPRPLALIGQDEMKKANEPRSVDLGRREAGAELTRYRNMYLQPSSRGR